MIDALSEKIRKIEALMKGRDIQYILNEVYKILGHPLFIYDMDYNCNLKACTEDVITDDPIWNDIVQNGKFSDKCMQFFKDEFFLDTAANTKTISFLISDKLEYSRLYGKLFNRDNINIANLVMVACFRPFRRNDTIIFEAVCAALSREIYSSGFYLNYGRVYQEKIINKLIDGEIEDKKIFACHAANIDNGLKSNIYVAAADISRIANANPSRLTNFRESFNRLQPSLKYAVHGDYIVIIISSDGKELDVKKYFPKLVKFFEQKKICTGISGCFENIFDLPKHYRDAVRTLKFALKNNLDRHIFLYDEIFPYRFGDK